MINNKVNEQTLLEATKLLGEILAKKNSDYGNSVEKEFNRSGGASLIMRLRDKLNRLENLIDSEEDMKIVDEALSDTFLDIAGYATHGYILTKKINKNVDTQLISLLRLVSAGAFSPEKASEVINRSYIIKSKLKGDK